MLDQNDLQAIAELLDTKIVAAIAASEERTAKRIEDASRQAVRDAVSQAVAYSENTVERKLDVIKEGLDLALETHIPVERIERIEEDVTTLKSLVHKYAAEVEHLKKAQ